MAVHPIFPKPNQDIAPYLQNTNLTGLPFTFGSLFTNNYCECFFGNIYNTSLYNVLNVIGQWLNFYALSCTNS